MPSFACEWRGVSESVGGQELCAHWWIEWRAGNDGDAALHGQLILPRHLKKCGSCLWRRGVHAPQKSPYMHLQAGESAWQQGRRHA